MNALFHLALSNSASLVERLGWVLVHSLWQFALLALLVGWIVRTMRNRSAAARYGVLVVALALVAITPFATWLLLPLDASDKLVRQTLSGEHEPKIAGLASEFSAPAVSPLNPIDELELEMRSPEPQTAASLEPLPLEPFSVVEDVQHSPPWSQQVTQLLRPWLAWIVAGWSLGVVICSVRPLLGWYTLRRLRQVGVSEVSDEWLATLRSLADRMGVRRAARLLHTSLARVPLVVGYFRPVILLPVSLVTSIPATQLEAILAHELAHIRRHDFPVNLLQTLIETMFFYHPAVWWLSRRVRLEREHCCDDVVVHLLGNRAEYGRALLAIEELCGRGSVLALGATDGTLLSRVRRIIGLPSERLGGPPWPALSLTVCGIVGFCAISLLSWNRLAEADAAPNAERKQTRAEFAAQEAEIEGQRTAGQEALDRGDYQAMAEVFESLSSSPDADYLDAVWQGHALHLAGNWQAASNAYQRAIALVDKRLKELDQQTGPEFEEDPTDNGRRTGPEVDWKQQRDRRRERIQDDWPMLVLLAGRVQLSQLDDATSAARTLSRGLRFAPEAESLDKLAEAAIESKKYPPKSPHPLWFKLMMPIATQRELALAHENLGDMEAAADCWARVHLCHLAYKVGMARVDADHLVKVVTRIPAEKRRPFHELVLENPGTLRRPKPQAFDYQEQLARDARNPFQVAAKLDGFQMTKLGPSRVSLAKLPDGQWIMAYVGGDEFQAGIYLSSSADGKTWSVPWEFAHNNVFPTRSPSLIVDNDGTLWMLCSSKRLDLKQFSSGEYRLWLCSSRDGRTWSGLRPVNHSLQFSGQYQQTAHLARDRQGKFWVISPKEVGSAESPADLRELRPLSLGANDSKRFIEDMHVSFDDDNRCHLLFSANGLYYTSSRNMVDWPDAVKLDGKTNEAIRHPQTLTEGNHIAAVYETARGGWLRSGTIDGDRVAWSDPVAIGLPLGGSLLARDGERLLLPSGPIGNGAAPVLLAAPLADVTKLASLQSGPDSKQDDEQQANVPPSEFVEDSDWGTATNGLKARVVPVLSSMSEDKIDPTQRVAKFATADDVAFAVELKNVSDKPIKLLDTRYGDGYGKSKGKAHSKWYGQFLFSIDLFDSEGKLIERPDTRVVDLNTVLDGALVATLTPGQTHRFLLRPSQWLSAMMPRIETGSYRATVAYHGLPARVAARIKEYRPASTSLEAVEGNIVAPPVPFEVQAASSDDPKPAILWGDPNKGLRAAVSLVPAKAKHAHGQKPDLKLHVQNVSDRPVTLASHLWLSELNATVQDENGQPVVCETAFYSGWTLSSRVTIKPQQILVFDAGNLGLAITKERAQTFEHITNRTLVAPAGKYTIQLHARFGDSFSLKDGTGKVLAPLEGDWIGELKTAATPLEIENETIECNLIDAVSGKPVTGTTVNFRFLKPKTEDAPEEIVADIFWGPQAPSHLVVYVPDEVLRRADRDQIVVSWGVGGHADYDPLASTRPIALKAFFHEGTKDIRETLATIKLTPKEKGGEASAVPAARYSDAKEIVLSMNSIKFMLDLDSGETMDPPMTIRPEQKRMDIHPIQVQPYDTAPGLEGFSLQGVRVKPTRWNATVEELRTILTGDRMGALTKLPYDSKEAATYVFRTGDGAAGILQLLAQTDDPKGIRLRYKTLVVDKTDGGALNTAPPKGLEFLAPYPQLRHLSLGMTETQFASIVKQRQLNAGKTVDGNRVTYSIVLGDGHVLIVMFDEDAKCSGIQRIRGGELPDGALKSESVGSEPVDATTNSALKTFGSELVPGFYGGVSQTMQVDESGNVSYTDTKSLCHMTLLDDDRLRISFKDENRTSTDMTLPLTSGADDQQRAVWAAEMDGVRYQATAIPFAARGSVFRLETRRDGKLLFGALQFFAVRSKQENAYQVTVPVPIDYRQWRVDQSGAGVVAGHYTGAGKPMIIASDGTITFSDRPHRICHLAVLEDDRITATFRDLGGIPTQLTLPLVTTAAEHRASWSTEIDGRTLRATAIPFSDNVYLFRMEQLRDGKLIWGEDQVYAIDQKLRKALPEEMGEGDTKRLSNTTSLKPRIELPDIIARLKDQEKTLKSCLVTAETSMKQRTGLDFDGPELQREFKTEFRFDDKGRIYSKQQGGVPGRIGTSDVLQQIEVGVVNGRQVTILRGQDKFNWAYRGPDWTRIPREIDPREHLCWYRGEPLSQFLGKKKYHLAGSDRWRGHDVIVIESDPTVIEAEKLSYQGRLFVAPALDCSVVVRTARIRFDDVGPEWHEYSRQETFNYEQDQASGLWFPKNGTYTSLNPTREQAASKQAAPLAWKKETKFTLWKPNPQFTDADFTLEIPPGIFVMDDPIPAQTKEDPDPTGDLKPAKDSDASRVPTADEVFVRKVSLKANNMPLKLALAELARQARVKLQLDTEELKAVELDVDKPVTVNFADETLDAALGRMIYWRDHFGAFREFRGGQLVLSTIPARQQQVAAALPEWLRPFYTHGLLADLDEENEVVSITTSSIMTDELLEKLAALPKLRALHIEVTKALTPAGLKYLASLRALETLSLYEVNAEGNGLGDEALQAIAGLESLRELRVNNCGLTDVGARHMEGLHRLTRLKLDEGRLTDAALSSIGKLKALKHLDLSSHGGSLQYGRMHFSAAGLPALTDLSELKELHLVGQDVTGELLTAWPKLIALSIGGPTVDDACAERIADCRDLGSLSLVYTAVDDAGIKRIATLPALLRLNIDSRFITDAAVESLRAVTTLEVLSLRTTRLTDDSLAHLAQMPSLTRLDLHGSGLPGAVSGENFSINGLGQLKGLPRLYTLWLTNFRSPGGYLGLADLKQLRELSLMMADIRSDDLEKLEEALPDTTIHCSSGGGFLRPTK